MMGKSALIIECLDKWNCLGIEQNPCLDNALILWRWHLVGVWDRTAVKLEHKK